MVEFPCRIALLMLVSGLANIAWGLILTNPPPLPSYCVRTRPGWHFELLGFVLILIGAFCLVTACMVSACG